MSMTPFTQFKPWMIERYGEPLFRIPVEIASSCPHGRCAFCSENGARAQQTQQQDTPAEQAEEAIRFAKRRYRAKKFALYIQAFTADLTQPDQQTALIDLLQRFEFTSLCIGTRPDCLPEAAIDFLVELKENNPALVDVWIELGVQTTADRTLERIHRGHDWACSKQAIETLAARGIDVAPHVIIGLPGEGPDDWNRTATDLAALPISGIKIHNLHIMENTELATQYANQKFPLLSHWEYAEALIEFLQRIPAAVPIMRLSTDTPKDQLVAPHWELEKGQFIDYLTLQMTCREISQGSLEPTLSDEPAMQPVETEDGSITFFSNDWKEHYHTQTGARLEATTKFVDPSQLTEKLATKDIHLLDLCFGLGNNSLAALIGAQDTAHHLKITALEIDKRVVRAAANNFQTTPLDPVDWRSHLHELLSTNALQIEKPAAELSIQWGDARWLLQNLATADFDIVFHDSFSTQRCPELWTVDFFKQLIRIMKPDGVLCTYSSSAPVRSAMREAGFFVAETVPGNRMGNGTLASASLEALHGFTEVGPLEPRRATPYRDPTLCATSKAILRQRQETVEAFPKG